MKLTTLYTDDEIYCREMRVMFSSAEWCKFHESKLYKKLVNYVWERRLRLPQPSYVIPTPPVTRQSNQTDNRGCALNEKEKAFDMQDRGRIKGITININGSAQDAQQTPADQKTPEILSIEDLPKETLAWLLEVGAEKAESPFAFIVKSKELSEAHWMSYTLKYLAVTPIAVIKEKLNDHIAMFSNM